MKKLSKKLSIGMLIGIIVAIGLTLFMKYLLPGLWVNLENKTYDLRFKLKYSDITGIGQSIMEGVKAVDVIEDIVIVNIDERSMLADKLGYYGKWPRSYHGEIIDYLTSGNAAATAFDIHFNDADYGQKETSRLMGMFQSQKRSKRLTGSDINKALSVIQEGVNYDREFVEATREAGNVIHAMILSDTINYANKSDYIERTTEKHRLASAPGSSAKMEASIIEALRSYPVLDGAFPALAQAAKRIGLVNVDADEDGIHRTLPLLLKFREYVYPAIALQCCLRVMGKTLSEVKFVPGQYLDLGQPFYIKKEKDERLTISYPGLSELMIRQLLKRREDVKAMKNGESVPITEKIAISRGEDGQITMDILAGTLSFSSIRDLNGIRPEALLEMVVDEPAALGKATTIVRTGKREFTLVEIANDEEPIEEIPLSTLSIIAGMDGKQMTALRPGETYTVCENLTVSRRNNRYETEYILLRGRALEALLDYSEADIEALPSGKKVAFGTPIKIPVDKHGRMRINYQGPKQVTFKTISYFDIKSQRVPAEYFCGKIFLIGSDAPSMFDIVSSPVDEDYPGVEIHATVIANLLNNDFLTSWGSKRKLAVLLLLCLVVGVVTFFLRPLFAIIIATFISLGYFVYAMSQFDMNMNIEVVKPILGIFSSFVAVIVYRYITEERDKRFLKATFEQYLSPSLIDQMYESKQMPALGGEEGIRTAYFTDIQSFSTFSERLGSPTKLVELLNEYLSAMTDILMEKGGTLDKYEGDAIIAFFGAPMHIPDHAAKACMTAIGMQRKLLELRKKWVSEGKEWPDIVHNMRMRIGINSGPLVTGNMGSKKRMNYTMMGDAVNLAARLEGAAKQYGVFTMISHFTREMIDNKFEIRELDKITVVGKSEPVTVFELISEQGNVDPKTAELIGMFQEGLDFYKKQSWGRAVDIFEKSKSLEKERFPDTKTNPSEIYINRCQEFKANPPSQDWDGIYRLTAK
jgi:adenylate cyclase